MLAVQLAIMEVQETKTIVKLLAESPTGPNW